MSKLISELVKGITKVFELKNRKDQFFAFAFIGAAIAAFIGRDLVGYDNLWVKVTSVLPLLITIFYRIMYVRISKGIKIIFIVVVLASLFAYFHTSILSFFTSDDKSHHPSKNFVPMQCSSEDKGNLANRLKKIIKQFDGREIRSKEKLEKIKLEFLMVAPSRNIEFVYSQNNPDLTTTMNFEEYFLRLSLMDFYVTDDVCVFQPDSKAPLIVRIYESNY